MKKLVSTVLILILFTSGTLIASPRASANSEIIPVETAIQVIESDIKSLTPEHEFFGLWDNVQVIYRADLYDIHDNVMGYYFQLMEEGKSVGYYISGARYTISPILEYSSLPAKDSLELVEKGKKLYYFGGELQTTAANSDEILAQIELKLKTYNENLQQHRNVSDAPTMTLTDIIKKLEPIEDSNAIQLWQQKLNLNVSLLANPSAYSLAVPHMYQYQKGVKHSGSACGPTSLSMAIQYLDSIGLNVHDISYFNNSESDMINGMYNYLGTGVFGTMAGNMSYMTTELLNMHMNGWTATTVNADDSGATEKYKDRIVSSRPPMVMWDTLGLFPWLDPDVTWHWQTGSAYRTKNGAFELGVKDPSNSSSSTVYYNWSSNKKYFLFTSYSQR